ncbi:MAG: hypothetical protein ACTSQN_16495 [Candidatus Heimdallarchaeota archaeon]
MCFNLGYNESSSMLYSTIPKQDNSINTISISATNISLLDTDQYMYFALGNKDVDREFIVWSLTSSTFEITCLLIDSPNFVNFTQYESCSYYHLTENNVTTDIAINETYQFPSYNTWYVVFWNDNIGITTVEAEVNLVPISVTDLSATHVCYDSNSDWFADSLLLTVQIDLNFYTDYNNVFNNSWYDTLEVHVGLVSRPDPVDPSVSINITDFYFDIGPKASELVIDYGVLPPAKGGTYHYGVDLTYPINQAHHSGFTVDERIYPLNRSDNPIFKLIVASIAIGSALAIGIPITILLIRRKKKLA